MSSSALANPFKAATKEASKIRMALTGPSGSGKTWTALLIAETLVAVEGGKIAFIDSEGRSARKYAHRFKFDVLDLTGDYSPARYIEATKAAIANHYTVIIIDSLSHGWNASGGVLEIVDKAAEKMGDNKWAGWSKGRPQQNGLVETLVSASAHAHVIATMRARTEWLVIPGGEGKKAKYEKIGLDPVQSSDIEYEFDLAATLTMEHVLMVTKSRCEDLPLGEYTNVDHFTRTLHAWASDGEAPAPLTAKETYLSHQDGKNRLTKVLQSVGATKAEHFKPYLEQIEPGKALNAFGDTLLSESELHTRIREIALNLPKQDNQPEEKPSQPPQQPAQPPVVLLDNKFFTWTFKEFMLDDSMTLEALSASVDYNVPTLDKYREPAYYAMAAVICYHFGYDKAKIEPYTSTIPDMKDESRLQIWEYCEKIIALNQPPQTAAWNGDQHKEIYDYLFQHFRLDKGTTLETLGKSDWSEFGNVDKAKEAIRSMVLQSDIMLVATEWKKVEGFTVLNTTPQTRMYGNDLIRALEPDADWALAQADTIHNAAKGTKGTFPRPLLVGWRVGGKGNNTYYQAVNLTIISEEDDDWSTDDPKAP